MNAPAIMGSVASKTIPVIGAKGPVVAAIAPLPANFPAPFTAPLIAVFVAVFDSCFTIFFVMFFTGVVSVFFVAFSAVSSVNFFARCFSTGVPLSAISFTSSGWCVKALLYAFLVPSMWIPCWLTWGMVFWCTKFDTFSHPLASVIVVGGFPCARS